jgi:ABC-type bacteriocin/lantibiotic exporter with double-glycine peptidase domain
MIAIIGYMLVVQPDVALLALALLAPQVAIAPWLQRRINRLNEHRLGLLRDLSDRIVEREEQNRDQPALLRSLDAIYENHIRIYLIKFLMKAATNSLGALAPLTVLLVGSYFVMIDETTIGVVVAFISGFQRLAEPVSELLTYYRTAAQANVQHGMIADWMRDEPQPRRSPHRVSDGGIGDSPLPDDGGPDAPAGSSAAFRSS